MASINEIADALCSTIHAVTGVRCTQVVDNPILPCVMVYPDSSSSGDSYYTAFRRGQFEVPMIANVIVNIVDRGGQQRLLNDIITAFGEKSIPQAIYLNPTLGTDPAESTAGEDATMTATTAGWTDYGFASVGDGTPVLQAKLRINVMTRGDS